MNEEQSDHRDAHLDMKNVLRRFSSPEEAMAASRELLERYGGNSEVVRLHRSMPVDVPFEL